MPSRSISVAWSMLVGFGAALLPGACVAPPGTHPPVPHPETVPQLTAAEPSTSPTVTASAPTSQPHPGVPAPSLDQERQLQAQRAALTLQKKVGVQLEGVGIAGPAWWPRSDETGAKTADVGLGSAHASTLEAAFQQATRAASQPDASADIDKAAYFRDPAGAYQAWVRMKAAGSASINAPGAVTPGAPIAPAINSRTPADPDVPSWFTTTARESAGRVTIGAMADAPSVREAPRMATEVGRSALAQVLGRSPAEVRLESTYVRKQGDAFRAYVLVSCPGTIRK